MAKKINRAVMIDGKRHWIRANTEQEYADKIITLCRGAAHVEAPALDKHKFADYALNWFEVYSKPTIQTATAATYERQLTRHIIPALGTKNIEDITPDDIQLLFNGMSGAKTTKQKTKNVMNMVFEAALEDGLITKNPAQSKRVKIVGSASKTTEEYSVDQMRFLVDNLPNVKNPVDRAFLALLAFHPLRLEEALGLKWSDIDLDKKVLHVNRAVTHPKRNQPEIKSTKTAASTRTLGLSHIASEYLTPGAADDFVFGGSKPLSYTLVRKMCNRIQADTGFTEKITPIRFRTTVLTDIYDQTKDIKQAQAAAGHTTSAMTLKHYVKGRGDAASSAAVIDLTYGGQAV